MANLETPTEGMARDFAAGQQLAGGFMQNYWRAREGQLNEARYVAGQALRDVQLSLAQSQLQTVQNAATVKAQQDAAVPGLFRLWAEAQARGYDADTKLKVYQYGEKNPFIANSEVYKGLLSSFNESEKITREKELFEEKRKTELEIAKIRADREERNTIPTYTVNALGEPIEVTAGGAVRPIKAFSPVEQAEIESTVRVLTKEVEDEVGSRKVKAQEKLDNYLRSVKDLEKQRNEEKAAKIKAQKEASTGESVPADENRLSGWRAMIAGQDPNMVGNLPARPAPVTATQPSTNAFKIRLKSP